MADKTVLLGQIVAEQEDFAALQRGLTDEQWAASSLCEGWTVRDTAIHTAWHIHLKRIGPVPSFGYARDVSQFLLLGGTKFDARQRERDGARSNEDLIDWIASPAEPTLTNLGELMIHQQDARRPLGLGRRHSRRSAGLTLELLHVADWRRGTRCRVWIIQARAGIPSCRHRRSRKPRLTIRRATR